MLKGPNEKYAWSVKIGEKGQFVIPKEAREMFDFKPGDTIVVLGDKKLGIAIPPKGMLEELAKNIFGSDSNEEENE